jgi:signal peptidase II
MRRDYIFFIITALVVVIIDQLSKIAVAGSIRYYESIPIIDGFLNLVHVRNRGMAFGLMNRPDEQLSLYFLISATVIAIILLILWFNSLKGGSRGLIFGLSLILGGAIGNLIDRLRLKEVVDFIDFFIGKYHWPAFNVADSAITVGVFWIVINVVFFSLSDDKTKGQKKRIKNFEG